MPTQLWVNAPGVLFGFADGRFDPRLLTEITYSASLDEVRNTNALARFIVFWVLGVWIMRGMRRPPYEYMFIGAILLFLTSSAYRQSPPPSGSSMDEMRFCQAPSHSNPLANAGLDDFNNGARLPACPPDAVAADIERNIDRLPITRGVIEAVGKSNSRISDRTFYSMPVTTVPADRANFVHALYGEGISRRIDHGFTPNPAFPMS